MSTEQNALPAGHTARGSAWETLALPPVDRLPSDHDGPDALTEFVRSGTRPWGGVPESLSATAVAALWTILVLNLGLGAYLLMARSGAVPCSGVLCWAVTLGDHPTTTLVLSEVCAGTLAVSAPMTRGLSRASGPQLALIVVGALTGVVALAGLLGTLAVALLGFVLAVGSFALVAERL